VTGPPGLVIFDCDGVLVDSEPIALRILLEALDASGLARDAGTASDRFLGRSLASTRAILAEDFGLALSDAALTAMRRRLHDAFRADLAPVPGVADTLAALTQPFCVASSSLPERIELSLRLTGLWPRFEGRMFSATEVARGKPAPDLFLYAARSMGYAPSDCLVVEDSPAGIEAAKSAGMRVVAFTGGSHATSEAHRAAIAALGPDAVIDDMHALIPLVVA
jgi:HAD superfamily hydrolase (TIGR01509 family)